ncbi:MAG TPA: SDR family oxidoreductase [Gammaproteobacteria bacterium]|nr:SDR family oxidoreductase [Gammaproteobacteria bacterium]
MPQIAIVTGANRGIGLEVSRQLAQLGHHVIMTARDPRKGAAAMQQLVAEGLDVELRKLDVNSTEDCQALARHVAENHKGVDVLVNNAGILPESFSDTSGRYPANPLRVPPATVMEILNTNTLGPLRMIQAFAPLLRENARVVNVSSSMGQLSGDFGNGHLGYRMSKTALNAVTKMFANVLAPKNIKVNSVDPGWVRTDMGNENAPRSPAQGAASVVWAATLPPDGPSGGFFLDGERLEW